MCISISKLFSADRLLNLKESPTENEGRDHWKNASVLKYEVYTALNIRVFWFLQPPWYSERSARIKKMNITDINKAKTPDSRELHEVSFQTGNYLAPSAGVLLIHVINLCVS